MFSIEEIRNYLESQDTLLEALDNLSEYGIKRVNNRIKYEDLDDGLLEDLDDSDDELDGD